MTLPPPSTDPVSDGKSPEEERKSQRTLSEARRRKSPTASVVHEAVRLEGEEELERPTSSIAWSGLAAGLAMGFSMVTQGLMEGRLPDAPWRTLVSSLGYSAGFLFVTLGRQQLFTETTLTATLPLFHDRGHARDVARFWAVVFAANIAGTLLFALAATLPGLFPADAVSAFREIGAKAAEGGFGVILARAVVAGWLVALMVWLLPFAGTARILIVIIVTYLIAAAELSHVIAGSVEAGYAAIVGAIGWADYARFLAAAFLGNTIGGVLFVALLNHAQVRDDL